MYFNFFLNLFHFYILLNNLFNYLFIFNNFIFYSINTLFIIKLKMKKNLEYTPSTAPFKSILPSIINYHYSLKTILQSI